MSFNLHRHIKWILEKDPNCPMTELSDLLREFGWTGEKGELEEALKDRRYLRTLLDKKETKTEIVRLESARAMVERILRENPRTTNEEIRQHLTKAGRFKASTIQQTISHVRCRMKPIEVPPKREPSTKLPLSEILELKALTERLGGITQVRALLDCIEKIRS